MPSDWVGVSDMKDVLRAVAEAGARPGSNDRAQEELPIDVDCAKLARQLRHSMRTTIGLLPSSANVRIQPFALALAYATALLTERLTMILDPEQGSGAPDDVGTLFAAHVPAHLVVRLVPFEKAPIGSKFEMVRLMHQLAMTDPDTFGLALVDLSGCRFPGELLGATKLLEGIIVVGEAGKTSERDLLDTMKVVPSDLQLGVALTT